MSTISIIGTGGMAAAIGGLAAKAGHTVEVKSRDAAKARALAEQVGAGATTGTFGAAPAGDIVILAVPYSAVLDVVKQYGEELAGKLLVDITNPINSDFTDFVTPEASFGPQEIAKAPPADADVVKAFNTQFSHVLAAGPVEGHPLDVFLAGDDAQGKARMTMSPAGAAPNVPVVAPAPTCSASARAFAASRLITSTRCPALAARPPIAPAIPPDPMMLIVLMFVFFVFLAGCRAAPLFP